MSEKEINFSVMTNEEYKKLPTFEVTYGMVPTRFGHCLIALNDDKICYISLFDEEKENSAIDNLQGEWPDAVLRADKSKVEALAEEIFSDKVASKTKNLEILLRGTELQCNVWKELAKVKKGATVNYEQVAKAVGKPKAIRAVASAIAKNKVAYVIPCHRVIRKTGAPNKYRWGPQRKELILKWEAEN